MWVSGSWILAVSIGTLIPLILLTFLCVCRRQPNKRRHEPSINNNLKHETHVYNHNVSSNGDASHLHRELPKIPADALDDSTYDQVDAGPTGSDEASDTYAPVGQALTKQGVTSRETQPNDVGESSHKLGAGSDVELGLQKVPKGSAVTRHGVNVYAGINEHPYARVKERGVADVDTDTDHYDDPQVYAQASAIQLGAIRKWNTPDTNLYEPPPVPVKRFGAMDPLPEMSTGLASSLPTSPDPCSSDASRNVASMQAESLSPSLPLPLSPHVPPQVGIGAPSHEAQLVSLPPPLPGQFSGDSQDSTSSHQEIRYTMISVREPLATLRSQPEGESLTSPPLAAPTFPLVAGLRMQRIYSTEGSESHYAVVIDSDDQTYAEIESNSASSSVAYARIELPHQVVVPIRNPPNEPPEPPTVESLRTVAQAHSRHASSSSLLSLTPHSITATSPISPLPSSSGDPSLLYTVVNKPAGSRRSAPVPEMGASHHSPSDATSDSQPNPVASRKSSPLDEMYAKVRKNKKLEILPKVNDTSTEYHPLLDFGTKGRKHLEDSLNQEVKSISELGARPKSLVGPSTSNKSVKSQGYENSTVSSGPKHLASTSKAVHVPVGHSLATDLSKVSDTNVTERTSEKNAEKMVQHTFRNIDDFGTSSGSTDESSSQGYEQIAYRPQIDVDDSDSNRDPNYEVIGVKPPASASESSSETNGVEADPGYEKVKSSASQKSQSQTARLSFPPEDTDNEGSDLDDENLPGYEKIKSKNLEKLEIVEDDDDSSSIDPQYERVHHKNEASASNLYSKVAKDRKTWGKDPFWQSSDPWQPDDSSSLAGSDHFYERIANMDETAEPGYEKVKSRDSSEIDNLSDPGYERIQKSENKTTTDDEMDPNYERIKERGSDGTRGQYQPDTSEVTIQISSHCIADVPHPAYPPLQVIVNGNAFAASAAYTASLPLAAIDQQIRRFPPAEEEEASSL